MIVRLQHRVGRLPHDNHFFRDDGSDAVLPRLLKVAPDALEALEFPLAADALEALDVPLAMDASTAGASAALDATTLAF